MCGIVKPKACNKAVPYRFVASLLSWEKETHQIFAPLVLYIASLHGHIHGAPSFSSFCLNEKEEDVGVQHIGVAKRIIAQSRNNNPSFLLCASNMIDAWIHQNQAA
jgi:hypothetical protein